MAPHVKAAPEEAALHGHLAIVDMLLAYEEAPEQTRGRKLLAGQPIEPAKYVSNSFPDQAVIEYDTQNLRRILMAGCRGGHTPIVNRARDLIGQHRRTAEIRSLYTDALHEAAKHNRGDIIKLLLNGSVLFEAGGLSHAFDAACAWGHESALLSLIEHDTHNLLGPQEYSNGLKTAAMKGHYDLARFFLGRGSGHLNHTVPSEAFTTAAGNGFADVVCLLIKEVKNHKSYPSMLNCALNIASYNGHKEVADLLIREGADVNAVVEEVRDVQDNTYDYIDSARPGSSGWSNALQAALRGFDRFKEPSSLTFHAMFGDSWRKADAIAQEATIQLLLEEGADVNAVAGCPAYPLYTAAAHCSARVVQSLIDKGADVNASTPENGTALEAAANRELTAATVIRLLLQAGAVLPARNIGRDPALNAALAFFAGESSRSCHYGSDGRFVQSESIRDVLDDGPGAVVKVLLAHLPEEKAHDERYGLLLQMAAMAGDRECVELLLKRHVDVNTVGYYYGSALQAAARVGNVDVVQLLLDAGADVDLLQGAHGTALRAAVLGGHADVAGILIKHGADVNLRLQAEDPSEIAPQSILHLAVEFGSPAIVKMLLAAGADVNLDLADHSPVMIAACASGDVSIVQLLLAGGAEVNISGKKRRSYMDFQGEDASPLHMASAKGHESLVRILLAHGAATEKEVETTGTPLQIAAREGHLQVVRLLIEAGTNVDHNSHGTALSKASSNGHLEVVEELLKAGACIADPPQISNALAAACQQRHRSIVELLLEQLSGTYKEETAFAGALSAACERRDDETFELLLEYGAPTSPATLCQAAAAGLESSVRMILATGVNVDSDDGEGGRALHVAACHLRSAVVRLLVDHGADVHFQCAKYGSPLLAALEGCMAPSLRSEGQSERVRSIAAALPRPGPLYSFCFGFGLIESSAPDYKDFTECQQIVQTLVDRGVDVNTELRGFGNALHLASYMGSEVIVRTLLARGSDVNTCGGYFESALLAALEGDHPAIVELLLSKGINVNYPSSEHGTALHYACLHRDKAMVQLLLRYGADVNASSGKYGSPLTAAISRCDGPLGSDAENPAIVELLLQCGDRIQIKECDLVAAAARRSYSSGNQYLELLLEHDKTVRMSESVIIAAAGHWGGPSGIQTLQLLLERDGGLGVTEAMLKAVHEPEVMEALLQHSPTCRITPEILESAAAKSFAGTRLMQLLLEHDQGIPISEAVIVAALNADPLSILRESSSTESLLQLLLGRNGRVEVNEAMLKAAHRPADMKILLERSPGIRITQDVLEAAASTYFTGERLVRLLLEHDKDIKITPAVVLQACKHSHDVVSYMTTLLEHDPDMCITEEVLLAMLKIQLQTGERRRMVELLLRFDKKLKFTEKIRKAIDRKF